MSGGASKQDSVRIRFPCASCGRSLRARPELVGRTVRCPDCNGSTRVPTADAAGSSTSSVSTGSLDVPTVFDDGSTAADPTARVRFRCDNCHRMLKVHPSSRGQRVRCPKCGTSQRVPLEMPPPDASPGSPDPLTGSTSSVTRTPVSPSSATAAGSGPDCGGTDDLERRIPVVHSPVEKLDFDHLASASGETNSLARPVPPQLSWRSRGLMHSTLVRRLIALTAAVAALCVTAFVVLLVWDSMRGAPASPEAEPDQPAVQVEGTDRSALRIPSATWPGRCSDVFAPFESLFRQSFSRNQA